MGRLVDDVDGILGRNRVEVLAGWRAVLGEGGGVPAEADDETELLDLVAVGGDPLAQCLLQSGDALHLAVRRREEVCRERLQPAAKDMAVRVEEAGHHRPSREVDGLGVGPLERHHVCDLADREDLAVLFGQGLGPHRGIVHRQDRPARPDAVRLRLCVTGGDGAGSNSASAAGSARIRAMTDLPVTGGTGNLRLRHTGF